MSDSKLAIVKVTSTRDGFLLLVEMNGKEVNFENLVIAGEDDFDIIEKYNNKFGEGNVIVDYVKNYTWHIYSDYSLFDLTGEAYEWD